MAVTVPLGREPCLSPRIESSIETHGWRTILVKTISTDKARQGRRGVHVLLVLVCALVLAAIAWAGAEFYGESIDPPVSDQATSGSGG
jgi:hypothetical protein